jgi:hypothetical protein
MTKNHRAYNPPIAHGGFIHLDKPEEHGMKPNTGVLSGVENVYMISAFHQLHCLESMQKALTQFALGVSDDYDADHMEHCFSYLRQAVLCGSDATLESPDPEVRAIRGWGFDHDCYNWEGLLEWRDEHRSGL